MKTKSNTNLLRKGLSKNETNLVAALESILPKKSTGGDLLSFGASFIPGVGQFLSPAINMLDNELTKPKEINPLVPMKMNNNPFGNIMKNGGTIMNNGFKQYNTGTHESGGDLKVDVNGNASSQPVAAVQGKENMFKVGLNPFVMSDTLVNPETGKTFNKDAAKLNKSLPNASFNPEDKSTLKFGMERLSKLNDIMKGAKEKYEMMCGGSIKKYAEGGPFIPRRVDINGREYNYITDAPKYDPLSEPLAPLPQSAPSINSTPNPEFSSFKTDENIYTSSYDDLNSFSDKTNTAVKLNDDSLSYSPETKPDATSSSRSIEPFNAVAIGLKGLGLAKSFADSFERPEVEQTILPDYSKSDRYMQEANVDYTQAKQNAIGASNIGANVNRSASSNFAQYQNREMARVANLSDALGNIDMQENNARSNLNVNRARYEEGKAVDKANREIQNRINNQQNKANADYADEKLFTEISQIGSEFNKYQNFKNQIANNRELQNYYVNEALAMINSKNANFQLDPTFVEKLKSGNYTIDDVVKIVNMTGIKTQ